MRLFSFCFLKGGPMEELHAGYLTPHCSNCPFWTDNNWDFGCGYSQFNKCPHISKKHSEQDLYFYDGPVMMFGRIIGHLSGETLAVSERKARSNFAYRYKKEKGYASTAKISLPGSIRKGDI